MFLIAGIVFVILLMIVKESDVVSLEKEFYDLFREGNWA